MLLNIDHSLPSEFHHSGDKGNKPYPYPRLRYMGSKYNLLSWIKEAFSTLEFDSALDAFSGSGAVSWLLKSMGKQVFSNDFLHFSWRIAMATIENSVKKLGKDDIDYLLEQTGTERHFISDTFQNIFFTKNDLTFLDSVSDRIHGLNDPYKEALAYSALFRSCLKKQPRGVFTIGGNLEKYNDGRRDLRLSISDHFIEQIEVYNQIVFDNGQNNRALHSDIFNLDVESIKPDLVYMDPPYVPMADDNCYIKRYHFLEGLSKYWLDEKIMEDSKVRKIAKKFTPFSYRSEALTAFDSMFRKFSSSILVLSYSSNGFPDLDTLVGTMGRYKNRIRVLKKEHRYHFGTHEAAKRRIVEEYLIIGE